MLRAPEEGVRLDLVTAVEVQRAIVAARLDARRQRDVHAQPTDDDEVPLPMAIEPDGRGQVDDSFDELGLLDVRARELPAVELLAGQVVASFEGDGRFCAHGHGRHLASSLA